jgi:hypothetical protein
LILILMLMPIADQNPAQKAEGDSLVVPAASADNSEIRTTWGVSHDWGQLTDDIRNLSGIGVDQVIDRLEQAASREGIRLEVNHTIAGRTHFFVSQYQGGDVSIRLDGGEWVSVTELVTEITLRSATDIDLSIDSDWFNYDVGYDLDFDHSGTLFISWDFIYTQYFTANFGFAGADLTGTGKISLNTSTMMSGYIEGDRNRINFNDARLDFDISWTLDSLEANWRMAAISPLFKDITSREYDSIYWYCVDRTYSVRESWGGNLDIHDGCGEVDMEWDSTISFNIHLSNFPGLQMGFSNDQVEITLSDSDRYNEYVHYYPRIYERIVINRPYYRLDLVDGTTVDVVQVEFSDIAPNPSSKFIADVLYRTILPDSAEPGLGDSTLWQILDAEYVDWQRSYDDDDNELFDIEEDFYDSGFHDDYWDFLDDLEEERWRLEEDTDDIYLDASLYWLIDIDTLHFVSPQLLVVDTREDEIQLIGPADGGYNQPTFGNISTKFVEGQAAEVRLAEVIHLNSADDVLHGPVEEPLSDPESSASGFVSILIIAGLGLLALILIAGVAFVVLPRGGSEAKEGRMREEIRQEMEYDQVVTRITSPPPGKGPPARISGEQCSHCRSSAIWNEEHSWWWCEHCEEWSPQYSEAQEAPAVEKTPAPAIDLVSQVADVVHFCTLCQGKVKQADTMHTCTGCGKPFHNSCADRLDACPQCGSPI